MVCSIALPPVVYAYIMPQSVKKSYQSFVNFQNIFLQQPVEACSTAG
jgi:hypothetical protein